MLAKKHSPLLIGLLMLALLLPLGASSLAQAPASALSAANRAAAGPLGPGTTPSVTLEGGAAGDAHGSSADNAGDVNGDAYEDLIVGAPLADAVDGEVTIVDAGMATLYYGSAFGLPTVGDLTLAGEQAGERFGHAVAGIGDVNGDGFDDVAVSAILADSDAGGVDGGRVAIFHGSDVGIVPIPSAQVFGQAGSEFGMSLDGGDVNGDGFADLIVGAPLWDNGETDEGVAIVYYGSAGGITTAGALTLEMNQPGAHFGHSVAFAGDTDGEGFGDVVVGAPMYDNGETDEGAAFLFDGAAAGLSSAASWTYECNQAGAMCGEAVAGDGNLNGDAFADVVVGAPGAGLVHTFLGSASGLPAAASSSVTGTAADEFGGAVAFVGDATGDGLDDVLVGAAAGNSAALFNGAASGLAGTASWNQSGVASGDMYGAAVAGGDFDNDGFGDLAIGAPGYDPIEAADAGAVFVYTGAPDEITVTPSATATTIPGCLGTATPHVPSGSPPVAGLLQRQVANCYDDAHERLDTGLVYPLLDTVTTGGNTDGARYGGGFLFRNVEIPAGSRVISATLQLYARFQSGLPVPLLIAGDDRGQADDFFGGPDNLSSRPRTSAAISWTVTSRVTGWQNSPDLTGIVQEILDRGDWQSGNNLALLLDPAAEAETYATWAAFEGGPTLAGRLLIQFDEPFTPTPTATLTPTVTHTPTITMTPTATVTATDISNRLYLPIVFR